MKRFLATVIACAAICTVWAQSRTVRGTVTDAADGSPVVGVAVTVENGTAAAVTGLKGDYTIKVSQGQTLVFSFLGMTTQRHKVGAADVIDVKMAADNKVLDEVIVVAYGTTKKETFTGSAEIVTAEKLKDRPVTDVTKMLDGQVAGVMSTSGGGQPGSGAELRIRGFGSINASNSPLLVVDGVPFDGDLNSINSSDIESMSVLKDASAGALYGARGANGVILITTKQKRCCPLRGRTGRIAQREPERQGGRQFAGHSLLQHDVGPRIYGAHVPGVLQRSGLHGGLSSVRGSGDDRRPAGAPDSRHGQYL